jgi:hypothetical protein
MMIEANKGALREEYFLFHARSLGLPVFIPKRAKKCPDYETKLDGKEVLIEIGGASKGTKQFEGKSGIIFDDVSLMAMGCVQKTDRK